MNKGMQTVLGFLLFFLMLLPVIGSMIGAGEAMAFNTAKVELTQRVREGGVEGDNVNLYISEAEKKFDEFEVKFYKDNGATEVTDADVEYGDVITLRISAKGQGGYNFKKSKSKMEAEGITDGRPHLRYQGTILMDRRR